MGACVFDTHIVLLSHILIATVIVIVIVIVSILLSVCLSVSRFVTGSIGVRVIECMWKLLHARHHTTKTQSISCVFPTIFAI